MDRHVIDKHGEKSYEYLHLCRSYETPGFKLFHKYYWALGMVHYKAEMNSANIHHSFVKEHLLFVKIFADLKTTHLSLES